MGFLHDSTWQFIINVFVAILVGIVAVITSIVIAQKQRSRKEVSYEIVSDTFILNIDQGVKDKIEIRFGGKKIDDLRLVTMKIWNSGNTPVEINDYDKPITIEFQGQGEILDISVLETKPKDLRPKFAIDQQNIILSPLLLNNSDLIEMKMLLTGINSPITISARIAGVKEISKSNITEQNRIAAGKRNMLIFSSTISIIISLALTGLGELIANPGSLSLPLYALIMLMIVAAVSGFMTFIISVRLFSSKKKLN